MSYEDQAIAPGLNGRGDGRERLWPEDDLVADEDEVADLAAGLANVGFIRVALRRSRWFWAAMAIAGLIIGSGLYLSSPLSYQASTTLLLTVGPEAQPGTAILDNQAIVQSRAVAALALKQLGMRQDPGSFLATYTASVVTDRVLRITASARSSGEAVTVANAVAAAFLKFRAGQLQEEQQLQSVVLDQQVAQSEQHLKSITNQINQVSAQSSSSSQQAQLSHLRAQRDSANNDLTALKESTSTSKATSQVVTASMITGSKVIDAASPLAHSRSKVLILYAAGGLIIGLLLGMSIVVVRALISDRPHRRDDVARALGAPVKLSILAASATHRLMRRRGLAAAESREVRQVVTYLHSAVRTGPSGLASLAVIPIDDLQVAALSVVSLAVSFVQEGRRVVIADLCNRSPAARLLGVEGPGVQPVSIDAGRLVAVVSDAEEVAPVGPLGSASLAAQPTPDGQVAAVCASADVLLTLVALDPSVGAEHLATWAADAVVVVTAGRSSWSKIQAVGEMTRLAGTHLVSAVLVGSDKSDESLGVTRTLQAGRDNAGKEAPHPDTDAAAADRGLSGRQPNDPPISRVIRW